MIFGMEGVLLEVISWISFWFSSFRHNLYFTHSRNLSRLFFQKKMIIQNV